MRTCVKTTFLSSQADPGQNNSDMNMYFGSNPLHWLSDPICMKAHQKAYYNLALHFKHACTYNWLISSTICVTTLKKLKLDPRDVPIYVPYACGDFWIPKFIRIEHIKSLTTVTLNDMSIWDSKSVICICIISFIRISSQLIKTMIIG